MLALNGNTEKPGEAGEEVGIGNVELAGFGLSTSRTPNGICLSPPRAISTLIARRTP